MFKIWDFTHYLVLFTFLCSPQDVCRVSFMKKSCRGTKITLRKEFSLTGNEGIPASLLSNVHTQKNISPNPSLLYRPLQAYHLHGRSGPSGARIVKLLRSPRIDSKESILPAYVAWRAGTTTLFLLSSYPHRLFKNSSTGCKAGGMNSLESIPGLLKSLNKNSLKYLLCFHSLNMELDLQSLFGLHVS